jgi:hypothetical protein
MKHTLNRLINRRVILGAAIAAATAMAPVAFAQTKTGAAHLYPCRARRLARQDVDGVQGRAGQERARRV